MAIEFRQVAGHTLADLFLHIRRPSNPSWQGQLHRSAHGEKGVGDDLETRESRITGRAVWPCSDNPGRFHLWQPGDLA